jgi:hypothetical protein
MVAQPARQGARTATGAAAHGRHRDVCTTRVVERGMATYLRHNPGDARFWSVKIDRDGQPAAADIARAAPLNVQIRIALDDPGA